MSSYIFNLFPISPTLLRYPHLVNGVIAASAPIWSYLGEQPEVDAGFFAKGTTYDASEGGGSAPACIGNVKRGWATLKELGANKDGEEEKSFRR